MRKCYFLCVLYLVLAGCKKSDEFFQTKGSFKTEARASTGSVMMYTYQKQVTNQRIIADFIDRHKSSSYFTSESSVPNFQSLRLILSGDGRAKFLLNNSQDTILAEVVQKTSSKMLVLQLDSIIIPYGFSQFSNRSRCAVLGDAMSDWVPERTFLSPNTGYSAYITRPGFQLRVKNGQLVLPLISRIIKSSSQKEMCSGASGYNWNIFNDKVIQELKPGDTIVYQPMEVKMMKVD